MRAEINHNLSEEELCKALAALAEQSDIGEELLKAIKKKTCACDDNVPKEPKHPAIKHLYHRMQEEITKCNRDILAYIGEITAVPLAKAIGKPASMTNDQLQKIMQAIKDRYGYLAAQMQSEDYQPPPDMLYRWQQMGLVSRDITPETFMASIPAEMQFIRNAYLMGRFIEAVESGKSYQEVMSLAVNSPTLLPDAHAIAVAEQQTAMYLTDNAADLATKVGQLAIKHRTETIRKMAVDYHSRKLKRIVLDEDLKREAGEEIPERFVENWQQFKSELHQTMDDKSRDLDRVAYFEINDAVKQGQANRLLEEDPDKLVYKQPLPTACAQCKYAYLLEDGKTPRLFRLSEMIKQGTNINRKPHPTKSGKVVPGGRVDGAETMKPVVGLMHCFCSCGGVYTASGYESWITPKQKALLASAKQNNPRQ